MDEGAVASLKAVIEHDIEAVQKLHGTVLALLSDLEEAARYRDLAAVG